MRRALSCLALVSTLTACYSYRTVPMSEIAVGQTVRARLSAPEAERVGRVLGHENRTIEGKLLDMPGRGVLIAVPSGAAADNLGTMRTHQRIEVPREGLLELEVRRLDRVRTGGIVAVAAAAVAVAAVHAFGGESTPPGPGKGGVDKVVVPLLIRVPLGR